MAPPKGFKLTQVQKDKISKRFKGVPKSPEMRAKLSATKTGTKRGPLPEAWRKKISEANKGKMKGEKNPQYMKRGPLSCHWKGGVSYEPYCPKFTKEFKERVRAFFGYTCQKCGHIWQLGEKKLAVHHVNYRKDACCHPTVIPLFVPVCAGSCHSVTGHNRGFWEPYFTTMINLKHGGKCYFSKEEYDALMA